MLCIPFASTAFADFQGQFEKVGDLPKPNSLSVVLVEEYFSFSCPHCNHFRDAIKPFLLKFKGKIKYVGIPVVSSRDTDLAPRLYFLAEKMGKAELVKDLIFDAHFNQGVNINDPGVVGYLARSAGLGEIYKKEAESEWVEQKLFQARMKAVAISLESTPTLVV
ncbi:MAG: thioredoxin domain-containing protein, partial [Deltaproteobacteria bacterium]|nr:thioredoxin domain-containing protein [Deltaproteobacteria bacterium]